MRASDWFYCFGAVVISSHQNLGAIGWHSSIQPLNRHGHWPELSRTNIGAVALSLRTKAGRCLKTTTEWKESWCPDPEANVSTEGATTATTYDDYVKLGEKPEKSMWLLLNLFEGSGFICIGSNPTNHRFPTPQCSCTLRMDTSPLWTLMKHMTHNAVGKSFFGGVSSRKSRWLKPAPSSTGKTIVFNYKTATAKQAKQHVALDPLILASIVDHTKLNEAKKYQGSNRSRNTSIPRGCSRKPCSCGGDYVFFFNICKEFLKRI